MFDRQRDLLPRPLIAAEEHGQQWSRLGRRVRQRVNRRLNFERDMSRTVVGVNHLFGPGQKYQGQVPQGQFDVLRYIATCISDVGGPPADLAPQAAL